MSKVKEYWTNNKKVCVLVIVALIGFVVYLTTGQDINEEDIADKACTMIGGC